MTAANEQEMSHADRHDLDKLARWKADLDASAEKSGSGLPYCAIFLVGPEHRASHDIFRRYRSAFEELGGGFHNLVIFGQHGVSTTQTAFLEELGLEPDSVPVLAIAGMSREADAVGCIELPKGDYEGELDDTQTWGAALKALAGSVSEDTGPLLKGIGGVESGGFSRGPLGETVNALSEELG